MMKQLVCIAVPIHTDNESHVHKHNAHKLAIIKSSCDYDYITTLMVNASIHAYYS